MRITIEPTSEIFYVSGFKCRPWRGQTDKGVECIVFVGCITCIGGRHEEFAQELLEIDAVLDEPAATYLATALEADSGGR